jgi:hypothetical protein
VREAWVIAPQGRTVEVLQLSAGSIERSGLYGPGDAIVSRVLSEQSDFTSAMPITSCSPIVHPSIPPLH